MRVDALVAGGGPAGCAAAMTLARAGRSVVLVEPAAGASAFRIGEALPPAAVPLLRDLGFAGALDAALPSYGTSSTWGSEEAGAVDFLFDPNGHGWHLDRARFDERLRELVGEAGVDVRADGEGVRPGVRVDATGRRAAVARSLGARRVRSDRLVALAAVFSADDGDARTVVASEPRGWWYAALVPGGRRVVAFLTDADLLPRGLREPAAFAAAAGGGARLLSAPRVFPAHTSRLAPPAGDGWLACGDAALAFDPLSSQGITTALLTGLWAGEAIADGAPAEAYAERLEGVAAAYARNRADAYGLERRWPDAPFWARRHAAVALAGR